MICATLTLGLHLATAHFQPGFQDANPGVYARCDSVVAGVYANSVGRTSAYAAYVVPAGPFEVAVGVVSGYGKPAVLLVLPSYRFDNGLRVSLIPKRTGGVHFSYEF